MSEISQQKVRELLLELSEWLKLERCDPVEWLVCGGAALGLQGLISRTTTDVDVLGSWNNGVLYVMGPDGFSERVRKCIRRVAGAHPELTGMEEKWVNTGPAALASLGLPMGYDRRLKRETFGSHVTLYLLGRKDLIALKLYAAADRFGSRQHIHIADLKKLGATFDELDVSIDWMRGLPKFEESRPELQSVLEELGHDDLATYV